MGGGGVAQAAPTAIVNGDFEYAPVKNILNPSSQTSHFAFIYPKLGEYWNRYSYRNNLGVASGSWKGWTAISGFSEAAFGWKSTEPQSKLGSPYNVYLNSTIVEVQKDVNGNTYAEIVAHTRGHAIYQDIATTPGAVYKWKLDHTSITSSYTDTMSVMIGSTSSQAVQNNIRRTKSNGHDGGVRNVGNTISTTATNTANTSHAGQWATYEGSYLVPSGQTLTRFTFKSQSSTDTDTVGNLVDNISFQIAYPLHYNLNGGTSTAIPDPTASNYAGYYAANTSITLTNTKPTRTGYTFMGWAATKRADATNKATYDANKSALITKITMASPSKTVYAVWAKNPTVTFTDGQGKVLSTQTLSPGGNATAPSTPTRTGYTFSKWDKGYTGIYTDTTVTAQWNKNPKMTFVDEVTGEVLSEIEIPYNTTVPTDKVPKAPEHPFHDFAGYDRDLALPMTEDTVVTVKYARHGEVPVTAVWKDCSDYDGLRPESLGIELIDGAGTSAETTLSGEDATDEPNRWDGTMELGADVDVSTLACRVATMPDGYEASVENVGSTFIVTLVHVGTVTFSIEKLWDDMHDVYGQRPESLGISLMRDGDIVQEIQLSGDGGEPIPDGAPDVWSGEFDPVPRWDDDESMIEYGIQEQEVYGYDLVESRLDGNKWVVENRIWKHIDMPETGSLGLFWLTAVGTAIVAAGICMAGKRALSRGDGRGGKLTRRGRKPKTMRKNESNT